MSGGTCLGIGLARLRSFVKITHLQDLVDERDNSGWKN